VLRFRFNFNRKKLKSLERWTCISRFFISVSWHRFPWYNVLERFALFWAVQEVSLEPRLKIIQNLPAGNKVNCQQPPECVLLQGTVLLHLLVFGTVLLKKIFSVARSTCGYEAANSMWKKSCGNMADVRNYDVTWFQAVYIGHHNDICRKGLI